MLLAVGVTFRCSYLLFEVVLAGAIVDHRPHFAEVLFQVRVVLINDQACAIARLDVSPDHLHLFGGQFERGQAPGHQTLPRVERGVVLHARRVFSCRHFVQ